MSGLFKTDGPRMSNLHKKAETMTDQQYDNNDRGALFPENKSRYRNPASAPDFTGYIQLSQETLDKLQAATTDEERQVRVAGWTKQRRTGKVLSLAVSIRETQQDTTDESPSEIGDFLS